MLLDVFHQILKIPGCAYQYAEIATYGHERKIFQKNVGSSKKIEVEKQREINIEERRAPVRSGITGKHT